MLIKMLITLAAIAFVKPAHSFLFSSCPPPEDYMCVQYTTSTSGICPRPYNYVEEIAIAFDKLIVPKLVVLLKTNISVRSISPNTDFFPLDCRAEPRSMSRAVITLAHIEYVSDLINSTSKFQQALSEQPLRPLSSQMIRLIKEGMQNVEDQISMRIG